MARRQRTRRAASAPQTKIAGVPFAGSPQASPQTVDASGDIVLATGSGIEVFDV
jgi:hypothetical protein